MASPAPSASSFENALQSKARRISNDKTPASSSNEPQPKKVRPAKEPVENALQSKAMRISNDKTPASSSKEPQPKKVRPAKKPVQPKKKKNPLKKAKVNPKNKGLVSTEEKVKLRDIFLEKLGKANGVIGYPPMSVIQNVLVLNQLPLRATENGNLYKYFGKGSIRPPTKDLYIVMKKAIGSDDFKTTRTQVSEAVADAERAKIREVVRELEDKAANDRRERAKKAKENATETEPTPERPLEQFRVKPSNHTLRCHYNHALKCHLAASFFKEIQEYGRGLELESENDVALEIKVDEEYDRLLEIPEMARAFTLKKDRVQVHDLIKAVQELLSSYTVR